MGKSDEGRPSKSDKSSSPGPTDQSNNTHVYPDWAAMQAYYGPRVALPPYYNSAVASGHPPPPYMWPPQPMMPPYGSPYAAVYSPGGVYPHGAVPIGPQPHGLGAPAIPMAVSMSVEIPKSTEHKDRDLINNLKRRDGLVDNSNGATTDGEERRRSQSVETEGSSDGSEGETARRKKMIRDGTPPTASASITGELVGHNINMTSLELGYPLGGAPKTIPTSVQQSGVVLPETWSERELKRERRKQSNRESARRSRLRKQAEIEELARKVESLTAENSSLKSEISQMSEKSEKLRRENAALMEKLNNAPGSSINTENLLARVDNSNGEDESNMYERNSNSVAKLHQLLDTSPKADAVATS